MAGTVTHYAKIPSIAELCFVVVKIDLEETQDSSAKSDFHWKTMKCRLIIHTMQDAVIACPAFETVSSIHVVVGVEFFKTRLLQNSLTQMNMTWSAPRPVTPDVYANCLRYSILFAVAPRWNRAGQYLVNDKEFLTTTENNTAIRFNLTVDSRYETNVEVCLRLQPLKVSLCNVTLEGLGVPDEAIAHFMADPDGIINITLYGSHRVIVLPSLKRGKLIAALKKIPASSPFKNYGELRRHWKNMYGYRLPETDNGLVYYDVYFPMPVTDHFLYPSLCVRSQIAEFPYYGNRDLLIQSFLRDIHETQPMVCGNSLRIMGEKKDLENSSSTMASSSRRAVKEEPRTPEPMEKAHRTIDGPSTTRLSMSRLTPRHEIRRDSSSLMSPTPSLRGGLTSDETRSEKLRDVLSTIARFRETASSARFTRIKENPSEMQNQCPNVETNVGEEKTKPSVAIKSSAMEIESDEPEVLASPSNFAASSRETSNLGKRVYSRRGNNVEVKSETKIENSRGASSSDEARSEKLRGVLSTIVRFRETAASVRLAGIKEDPSETQNQCPNIESREEMKPDAPIKSSPMELESGESRVFMPRSNFAAGSREETATRNKIKIESSEIVSKYFGVPDQPDENTEWTVRRDPAKATLREKLLRNMTWDEKMSDDYE